MKLYCTLCHTEKEEEHFGKFTSTKNGKDYYRKQCKDCDAERRRKRRLETGKTKVSYKEKEAVALELEALIASSMDMERVNVPSLRELSAVKSKFLIDVINTLVENSLDTPSTL